MGRMRPAWYYQRQADQAEARANYFRTRTPPPEGTVVNSRGPSTTVFYRSMILKDVTAHRFFTTQVYNDTLQLCTAAQAGLVTDLPEGSSSLPLRGSGLKPNKIHWYSGNATPTIARTAWGTSWVRYYDASGDRSHYSIPFSRPTGEFAADDLTTQFKLLFGTGGTLRPILGAQNGRAYIEWEKVNISALT